MTQATIDAERVKALAQELIAAEQRGYQRGWNAAMESKAKRSACSDTDGARQGEAMEVEAGNREHR